MGIYRFLLAFLVLTSHCGIYINGKNQGVSAVVSFFIISGYSMFELYKKNYLYQGGALNFYKDRAMRIYPQFIFYLSITIILYLLLGDSKYLGSIGNIALNFLMIPLNWVRFLGSYHVIITPTWALGLEFQFYLLFPMILLKKYIRPCIFISILLFIPAYLTIIDTDFFGYRYITGTLFLFLIGSSIAKKDYKVVVLIYIFTTILFIPTFFIEQLQVPFNVEVLAGLLVGIPVVVLLIKINYRSKLEQLLGNLSYGIYLNHLFVIYLLEKVSIKIDDSFLYVVTVTIFATILSYISYMLIEKPISDFRHNYRQKTKKILTIS